MSDKSIKETPQQRFARKASAELTDFYIRQRLYKLKLPVTPENIIAKRLEIIEKRKRKAEGAVGNKRPNMKQWAKENRKKHCDNLTDGYIKQILRNPKATPEQIEIKRQEIILLRQEHSTIDKAEKICTRCKIKKPISNFRKYNRTKDGHHTNCNQCNSALEMDIRRTPRSKAWRAKYELTSRQNLSDIYVTLLLQRTNIPITPETVQIKRDIVNTKRFITKITKQYKLKN